MTSLDLGTMQQIDDQASYTLDALNTLKQLVASIGQDTTNVDAALSTITAARQNVRAYIDQHQGGQDPQSPGGDPNAPSPGQPADPYQQNDPGQPSDPYQQNDPYQQTDPYDPGGATQYA